MVATFGAAADAPFTAIVLGYELTRSYPLILPLMLACVVADLLAKYLLRDSLVPRPLPRRGVPLSTYLSIAPLPAPPVIPITSPAHHTTPHTQTVPHPISL